MPCATLGGWRDQTGPITCPIHEEEAPAHLQGHLYITVLLLHRIWRAKAEASPHFTPNPGDFSSRNTSAVEPLALRCLPCIPVAVFFSASSKPPLEMPICFDEGG